MHVPWALIAEEWPDRMHYLLHTHTRTHTQSERGWMINETILSVIMSKQEQHPAVVVSKNRE